VSELLGSIWTEPRSPHPPRWPWYDWALVGGVGLAAVVEGLVRPDLSWRALSVVVTVALVPTLLWRRSRPLLMVALQFGVSGVVTVLTHGAALQDYALLYVLLLPYALFRWGAGQEMVIGSAIILGKLGLTVALGDLGPTQGADGAGILLGVAAVALAFRFWAVARARELDRTRLLERERVARDLHDTVAHHVSAIAIRAQAGLAASAARPDAATEALRLVEAEASRALGEMRAIVRVLREDLGPTPGISDVERLATRGRIGPPVEVEIQGVLDDVEPAVGTAVYRLAQESITNARRHARNATRIQVRVAVDEASVRLRVSDDGEPAPSSPGARGYGITGMVERATLLGGSCDAGPGPDRGWIVTAVLPRARPAA
jgi:signal transduction histidine kinase